MTDNQPPADASVEKLHDQDCSCANCRRAWEEWMLEQAENERREAENREMERYYREHPHG